MTASDHLAPQALASLELFQDLPSAALDDVLTSARVWRLPRETRIFNQGDAGRAHALIEGSIRISQSGSDGAQIVMRFIAPGEMFGTVALFTDGRYPADAITLTASLEAPRGSTQRVEQRVARAVLRLVRQAGHGTTDGTAIEFPLRRKDVADISGTTLHSASRILTAWEKAGLLVSRNQRLTIRKPFEIQQIAERVSTLMRRPNGVSSEVCLSLGLRQRKLPPRHLGYRARVAGDYTHWHVH